MILPANGVQGTFRENGNSRCIFHINVCTSSNNYVYALLVQAKPDTLPLVETSGSCRQIKRKPTQEVPSKSRLTGKLRYDLAIILMTTH